MARPHDNTVTQIEREGPPPPPGELCLVVAGKESHVAYPLPQAGSITIGRGDCDIVIGESSISRHHLTLHLGPPIAIEDRSANGTRVRGERLPKHQRFPVSVGEMLDVGLGPILISVQA